MKTLMRTAEEERMLSPPLAASLSPRLMSPEQRQIHSRQHSRQDDMIAPMPMRTQTSEFMNAEDPWSGQQSPAPPHDEPDDIHAALRASRVDTWGASGEGMNGMGNGGFGTSPQSHFQQPPPLGGRIGSYGGLGGMPPTTTSPNGTVNNGNNIPPGVPLGTAAMERIKSHMTGPEETVSITILPEKEGMFMFQHRNYTVASSRRNSRVVRRYSDFVWLLDCLHKRYPFRALPLLPPKRIAGKFLFCLMFSSLPPL